VEFANSGHAPFIEERERFNEELLGFLGSAGGAGAAAGNGSLAAS
jgi:hypothetical protein